MFKRETRNVYMATDMKLTIGVLTVHKGTLAEGFSVYIIS